MVVVPQYVADLVEEFLSRHDGYSIIISEGHSKPSRWSEGSRSLVVRVTCPTGEPRLEEENA